MKSTHVKKIGRVFLWIFLAVSLVCSIRALADLRGLSADFNETVDKMIDEVSTEELTRITKDLTGANPVVVGGESVTITNRNTLLVSPLDKAEEYVFEHMRDAGLDRVDFQFWAIEGDGCDISGRQVVANIIGKTRPEEIVLLGAHLDNLPEEEVAPGADDNASGSAALMAAAAILGQHEFERTIRFVAFTGEEQGLCGSQFNAEQSAAEGENIVAMVNMDMIAFDTDNNGILRLDTRPLDEDGDGDLPIANTFVDVVNAYGIDLDPRINSLGNDDSDHSEYWAEDFNAIMVIEDYGDDLDGTNGDFNDNLHSTDDSLSLFNWEYYTNITKAVVGTIAHLALPEGSEPPPNDDDGALPVLAEDDFESGGAEGGAGWSGNWRLKGDSDIRSNGTDSAGGDFLLQLRGRSAATRRLDLSDVSSARLQFRWKAESLERRDKAAVQVFDGRWQTVLTINNGMDDETFHAEDFDLSGFNMTGDVKVRIKSLLSSRRDLVSIDDVQIVGR